MTEAPVAQTGTVFKAVRASIGFLTPRERAKYFTLIIVRALTGILDVLGIGLIGLIASIAATGLSGESNSKPVRVLGITLPALSGETIVLLVLAVLCIFIFKAISAILLVRGQAFFVAGVESKNAERIARFLLSGNLASAKRYSKAELQFALTGSTTYAFTGILNNVATLVSESFLLLVVTATLFVVNPVVAIFALAYFGIVVVIIQVFIGRSLRRSGKEAVEGTVETINTLSDTLDTFREISVLQKQDLFIKRITKSRGRIAQSGATMTFLAGMPRYVVETALILGVVILVSQQFLTNELATGLVTVGVFLAGGVRMMASLLPLQSALGNMKQNVEQAAASLDLLGQVRDYNAEGPASAELVPMPEFAPGGLKVELDNVSYRYAGVSSDVIRAVSLSLSAGSYVAFIGPSGAGKTTLVDLVLGLVEPSRGAVRIGGIDPVSVRKAAPGLVAYVPQKPGLVSGTIAENIALGVEPSEIDYDRIAEVIEAAHLADFIAGLPAGLATSVGKQVDALSGGQIQRIGVARALYSRPRLLVLDEATSGLDAGSEALVAQSLNALHGEVTVLVIAHRLSAVQYADVVHVVEAGRITASGSFKEVTKSVPMVAEYVRLMSFDDDSNASSAPGLAEEKA
jgi:ATP-binding cassette, subfamily B, bacterial PglK